MSDKIIYSNAIKTKNTLYGLISDLQNSYSHSQYLVVTSVLSQYNTLILDLQQLVKRQVSQEKRMLVQERCSELSKEYQLFYSQVQQLKQQQDAIELERKAKERNELGLQMHQRRETTFLDIEQKEQQVLDYTSTSVDQYITIGTHALQELYEQRTLLKSTQKRLLDVATRLGLSNTVMRFIEQRSQSDRWFLYGGIVVTLFLMYLIVHYLG